MASPFPIDCPTGDLDMLVAPDTTPFSPLAKVFAPFDLGDLRLLTPLRPIFAPTTCCCRHQEIYTVVNRHVSKQYHAAPYQMHF